MRFNVWASGFRERLTGALPSSLLLLTLQPAPGAGQQRVRELFQASFHTRPSFTPPSSSSAARRPLSCSQPGTNLIAFAATRSPHGSISSRALSGLAREGMAICNVTCLFAPRKISRLPSLRSVPLTDGRLRMAGRGRYTHTHTHARTSDP